MSDIVKKVEEPPEDASAGGGEFSFVLRARSLAGQAKLGEVWAEANGARRSSKWELHCDEGPGIGDDTAPSPLMYFAAAIGF